MVKIFCSLLLLFVTLLCFSSQSFAQPAPPPSLSSKTKKIKILSVDGGGIRGIIPALILQNLENRLKNGKHLTDCFDIMAGTSTGGIIVLILNVLDSYGKPKYNASHIADLYKELGKEIFHDSLWNRIKSGWGWFGTRYPEENLEKALTSYFANAELKDTLTQIIIPAYDIEQDVNVFFSTNKAQRKVAHNYLLKDVARATSAAPTYFNPAIITDTTHTNTNVLIAGGVSVNNPTLSAIVEVVKTYGPNEYFMTVSLGTGTNYGAKSNLIKKK
jgi:patatin-like phospholipase/acyl hydrolase